MMRAGIFIAWLSLGGAALGQCVDPPAVRLDRVANYMKRRFSLDPNVVLTVRVESFVQGTCIPRLAIQSGSPTVYFSLKGMLVGETFVNGEGWEIDKSPFEPDSRVSEARTLLTMDERPRRGLKEAPVSIDVFSDFQCPYCAGITRDLLDLENEFAGKVSITYRFFPLKAIHRWADQAAQYGLCSFRTSPAKFWPLHDYYFEGQQTITAANIEKRTEDFLSLSDRDEKRFRACLADPDVSAAIQKDLDLGSRLGVRGTPTLFVNGELVPSVSEARRRVLRSLREAAYAEAGRR